MLRHAFDSSDGNLDHLAYCDVGESVTCDIAPWPGPPFPVNNTPNPSVIWVTAIFGRFNDDHFTPGTFVKPYRASKVTGIQTLRYRCEYIDNDSPQVLQGNITITRQVSQKSNLDWKFTITKNGYSATIDPLP